MIGTGCIHYVAVGLLKEYEEGTYISPPFPPPPHSTTERRRELPSPPPRTHNFSIPDDVKRVGSTGHPPPACLHVTVNAGLWLATAQFIGVTEPAAQSHMVTHGHTVTQSHSSTVTQSHTVTQQLKPVLSSCKFKK